MNEINTTEGQKTAVPAGQRETPCYGKSLTEIEDVNILRSMVDKLWTLLDHIDTLDDACKDNDKCFRNNTRKYQRQRFEILESDGYSLFHPKP